MVGSADVVESPLLNASPIEAPASPPTMAVARTMTSVRLMRGLLRWCGERSSNRGAGPGSPGIARSGDRGVWLHARVNDSTLVSLIIRSVDALSRNRRRSSGYLDGNAHTPRPDQAHPGDACGGRQSSSGRSSPVREAARPHRLSRPHTFGRARGSSPMAAQHRRPARSAERTRASGARPGRNSPAHP